jgi:predicted ArsR family transcriptional regulator
MEKEVIRLAMRHSHPITPGDVCRHFALENKTARRWLQQLVAKKWMKPASGHARIRSYELDLKDKNFTL